MMESEEKMKTKTIVDVGAVIESSQLGWFHAALLLNTCLVMFIEGYDMQAAAYAAPSIIRSWHLSPQYFAPVFAFGLLGNLFGGTVLGHLGDSLGRKKVIVGGSIFFGIFTLAAAYATSLSWLLVLRFVAGIGIGASIPAAIALAVEYAPSHMKARVIGFLFFGYTMGGTAGGFVAAALIPKFGWPSVFEVGGIGPILLALLIVLTVPESIRFLALKQRRLGNLGKTLKQLSPGLVFDDQTAFIVNEQRHKGLPVRQLFAHGRGPATTLLWIAFMSSLLGHYFLTSWLPTILAGAAVPLAYAIIAGALLQGGGGVGGIFLCWLSDRKSILYIALAYCAACPFIVFLPHGRGKSLLLLAFLVGFFLVGGQIGLNSIAGTFYSTDVRSTGVGWALGVGRLGSIAGPVLGGILISKRVPVSSLFQYTALVALLCAFSIFMVSRIATKNPPVMSPALPEDTY
jgi:AAHS family 4-hydroxybenzoate transporter-like MFS transporter